MASSRILIVCSFALLISIWGCSSTKEAAQKEETTKAPAQISETTEANEPLVASLNYDRLRPSLADGYRSLSNEIPTHFLPKD